MKFLDKLFKNIGDKVQLVAKILLIILLFAVLAACVTWWVYGNDFWLGLLALVVGWAFSFAVCWDIYAHGRTAQDVDYIADEVFDLKSRFMASDEERAEDKRKAREVEAFEKRRKRLAELAQAKAEAEQQQ